MYNLFENYPGVKLAAMKENCPFIHDRSIVQYFDSLPSSVEAGRVVIDGCIDLKGNMKMRHILRYPRTFYLVCILKFYAQNTFIILLFQITGAL